MSLTQTRRGLAAAAIAALALTAPAVSHAQSDARSTATATLRVVHGLPGRDVAKTLDPALPVDVLVNGKVCLIKGLIFGQVSGPYVVPTGNYSVAISLANTLAPCSNPAVISRSVSLSPNAEVALVAALSGAGKPGIGQYQLDLQGLPVGKTRIMVAHSAAAPAVDVLANGNKVVSGLQPGRSASLDTAAGTLNVAVAPAGSDNTPVIGPVPVSFPSRAEVFLFAVGSAASGSIQLINLTIPAV